MSSVLSIANMIAYNIYIYNYYIYILNKTLAISFLATNNVEYTTN